MKLVKLIEKEMIESIDIDRSSMFLLILNWVKNNAHAKLCYSYCKDIYDLKIFSESYGCVEMDFKNNTLVHGVFAHHLNLKTVLELFEELRDEYV